jgi:hypothetical protein
VNSVLFHISFLLLRRVKKYSLIFLCCILSPSSWAQNGFPTLDELSFDLRFCGGAIYKHTEKVYLNPPAFSQEVEFSVSHRSFGKRKWERENNCPVPSVNLCFSQYGDELGNAISLYPGIEWAILRNKKFDWKFKIGGGIGLATDRWERGDTINNYLGSRLNNFTVIQTEFQFPIGKKINLAAGGRMSHISNGAFRIPNFGINLFSGFVGVNYFPLGKKEITTQKPELLTKRKINFGLRTGFAWGEQNAADGPLSSIYSQSFFAASSLLRKHRIYAGIDITHNRKALNNFKYALLDGNLNWDATNASAFVGVELLYGRVGIPFQFGVYAKKLRNDESPWYQKMGFLYYFYRNESSWLKSLYAGPLLKSNKINADYIEFCVGTMF